MCISSVVPVSVKMLFPYARSVNSFVDTAGVSCLRKSRSMSSTHILFLLMSSDECTQDQFLRKLLNFVAHRVLGDSDMDSAFTLLHA